MGGLWEAGVKSTKHDLKLSTDVDDLVIPNFLTISFGRPITSIVQPSLINITENKLTACQPNSIS